MLYSKSYTIMPATPIHFGPGISKNVGNILKQMGCQSVLVVADKSVLELGVAETVFASMGNAGISCRTFVGEVPNAPISTVNQVVTLLREGDFDTILGLGGGSAMDVAKAGRLFDCYPDAFTKSNLSVGGRYYPRSSRYKLICVPTLSGSGCEYMAGAVITDDLTHTKVTLAAGDLAPDAAIIDPILQIHIPSSITIASAVDSMCHAFNKICAPGCEFQYRNIMSLDAIKAIWNNLPVLVHKDAESIEARSAICYGSIMSGYIGGGPSGNFNHPIAHTISRFFPSVPHGIACGWALPITIRHILPKCSSSAQEALASIVGLEKAQNDTTDKVAAAFAAWLKNIGFTSPNAFDDTITFEKWIAMAPYIKDDSTWRMNPHYEYPDDGVLTEYLREAYHDFD